MRRQQRRQCTRLGALRPRHVGGNRPFIGSTHLYSSSFRRALSGMESATDGLVAWINRAAHGYGFISIHSRRRHLQRCIFRRYCSKHLRPQSFRNRAFRKWIPSLARCASTRDCRGPNGKDALSTRPQLFTRRGRLRLACVGASDSFVTGRDCSASRRLENS